MKKTIHCLLIAFLANISLFISNLPAQEKVSYLQNIKFQEALPAGSISGIIQDNYGFLWFATWTGLFRYDGNGIVNYTQKLGDQMGRKISCVYNSSTNHIWMGTFSEGLFVMNNTTNQLTKIDSIDRRRLANIFTIGEDQEKQVFIGMQDGLLKYDLNTKKHTVYPLVYQNGKEKVNCMITAFAQDRNKTYWIGTHLGLFNFDGKTGRFTRVSPTIDSYVYQIQCDNNKLWILSKTGFFSIDITNPKQPITVKHKLEKDNEVCMCVQISKQDTSKLWVGAYSGMYLIDKKDLNSNHTQGFEKKYDLQVSTFYEDRTHILWIATEKGVYKADFYQKRFHIQKDPDLLKSVLTVASNGKNKLWLGTWGKGLFSANISPNGDITDKNKIEFDSQNGRSAFYSIIYHLLYSREDYLWLATRGAGLYRLKLDANGKVLENKSYSSSNDSGIDDDYIMNIVQDDEGNIWAGSWDGYLFRYDKQKDKFLKISYFNDLEKAHHYPIVRILREKKGSLLLGTAGNGLVRLWLNDSKTSCKDVEHFAVPLEPKSLRWYFVLDMIQQASGDLLVSTEGGLARYDGDKKISYVYGENEGLPVSIINGIIEDNQKKVWLSTETGLFKLDFDGVKLKSVRQFTIHDGLQSNIFNQRSVCKLDKDNIAFGGEDGVCLFSPSSIRDASVSTRAVLTDFKLFNQIIESGKEYNGKVVLKQSISFAKTIELDHDENTFSIGFSALNFSAPQKIKYAYKLTGINNNWVTVDASYPYANFTKVKYGSYRFLVKCTNSDGVWSENETELLITINPPWWKSRLATFFYFCLIIMLLYSARYLLEYKHRVEMRQFEYKKNMEIYDTQLKFFTNISHEFRTPLTVIIGLTDMLKAKNKNNTDDNIKGIDRNARILKRLVDDLMDMRKIEKDTLNLRLETIDAAPYVKHLCENFNSLFAQKKVSFRFTTQLMTSAFVKVDKLRFESVIYNLLSNAFKFTPEDGTVTCTVTTEERSMVKGFKNIPMFLRNSKDKFFVIEIADTGAGISKADLPRIFDIYYSGTTYQKGLTNTIGTGIGLPFTKKIVELHQGFIEVDSEENVGSEFRVYIPLAEAVAKPITEIIQQETISNKTVVTVEEEVVDNQDWNNEEERSSKYVILVVDDNDDLRNMVRTILPTQYRVIEAEDGLEGYELAKKEVPDLIITDVLMPKMTGTELCEKLKQTEITNHIPIIMLTALPTIEDRIEGLRKGADSYIPKPFEPDHLLVRIEKLIESRERLKSRFLRSYIVQTNVVTEEDNYDPAVEFLNKVRASVDKNISNPDYSVGDLCQDIGMSRMQLFRKLKATTDISANKIIRMMRLEKAKKLLLRGDLNVADVTYSVGFNDLQYFRKCFKEEFGITPSDYVRQQKKS